MSASDDMSGLESQWGDVEKAITSLEEYVPGAGKSEWDAMTYERGVMDSRIESLRTALDKVVTDNETLTEEAEVEAVDSSHFYEKLEEVAPQLKELEEQLASTKNLALAIRQIRALAEKYESNYPVTEPKKVEETDPVSGVGTTGHVHGHPDG